MHKFCSNYTGYSVFNKEKEAGYIFVDSGVCDVYVKHLVCDGEWRGHVCFGTAAPLFCFEN